MSRFLRALSKVGLVELDESEKAAAQPAPSGDGSGGASTADIDRILAETRSYLGESGAAPAQPAAEPDVYYPPPAADPPIYEPPAPADSPVATGGASEIAEGQPLETLYAAASVPESPYPAEKLLKVLEGLSAMPMAVRKAAIIAMDQADDAWAIEDPILDAQRKIRALQSAHQGLAQQVSSAEARASADLAAQDQYQQEATATIRQQIAELEATLQQEVQQVAEQKAAIQTALQGTRDAAAREAARFEGEINNLHRILTTFGDAPPPADDGPPPPPPPPPE